MKTLQGTVTNITLERVTEEQALQWVKNNYGEFCTYIINQRLDSLGITEKPITSWKVSGTKSKRYVKVAEKK
jgi:hypothetical protein